MRSKYLPPQHFPSSNHETAFDTMDIDLDINMGEQGPSGSGSSVDNANDLSMDWEQWGEDCTIDLTLVQFDFNGSVISALLVLFAFLDIRAHTRQAYAEDLYYLSSNQDRN